MLACVVVLGAALAVARVAADDGGTPAQTGSVKGSVLFSGGEAPKGVVTGDAVIYLVGEGLKAAPPAGADDPAAPVAVLSQKDITYVPHVVVVTVGAPLEVRNTDAILHNVHTQSVKNAEFNIAQTGGSKETLTFKKSEIFHVGCDIHSQMSAWILVLENPYFARPGTDRGFEIKGVPPGHYTLRAWHEAYKPVSIEVDVKVGGATEINLDFADKRK